MHHEITLWLLRSTLSTSLALILIGVLRRPLRALFGAEISYRYWLLVPASLLVSLLPSPKLDSEVLVLVGALDAPRAIAQSVVLVSDAGAWWNFAAIVWSLGFAALLALGAFRYFALAKHVRALSEDTQGISTGSWVQSPMLFGLMKPRILVPNDFAQRFTEAERDLIVAHERMHQRRGDLWSKAVAQVLLACYWFNPLFWWARSRFEIDQEIACDAGVLKRYSGARRRYGETLLRTQLSTQDEITAVMPVACHWPGTHPLKERIHMLQQANPSLLKRAIGGTLLTLMLAISSFTLWAMQSGVPAANERMYDIHLNIEYASSETHPHLRIAEGDWGSVRFAHSKGQVEVAVRPTASGPDQIRLDLKLKQDQKLISTPSIINRLGATGSLALEGPVPFRIEMVARHSTSEEAGSKPR